MEEISGDDFERRANFCKRMVERINHNPKLAIDILFSNGAPRYRCHPRKLIDHIFRRYAADPRMREIYVPQFSVLQTKIT